MKYIIAFLFLCASTVFGAVPSFQAFDANFFQITGTGNNSIKIKTNNYTWGGISGGSGDSVWTNSAGVLMPVSTNAIEIGPGGGIGIGSPGLYPVLGVSVNSDAEATGKSSGIFQLGFYDYSGDGLDGIFSSTVDLTGTPISKSEWIMSTNANTDFDFNQLGVYVGGGDLTVVAFNESKTNFLLNPTAAASTTPYTFDTSVAHTSGNVFAFKNLGTNAVFADWLGNLNIGRNVADAGSSPNYQLIASRSTTKGETARSGIYLSSLDSENFEYYSTFDLRLLAHKDTPTGVLDMTTWATNGLWGEIIITTSLGSEGIEMYASGVSRLKMIPSVASGATPYVMDTDKAHTSGNLLEVKNNGTNKFVVAWDGTIAEATFGSATFSNVYFLASVIASNGVASYRSNKLAVASITIGASPVNWTNTSGANVNVLVDGVGVTGTVGINGTTIWNTIGQNTVPLQHGEWTTITYTVGTPTAFWKPL